MIFEAIGMKNKVKDWLVAHPEEWETFLFEREEGEDFVQFEAEDILYTCDLDTSWKGITFVLQSNCETSQQIIDGGKRIGENGLNLTFLEVEELEKIRTNLPTVEQFEQWMDACDWTQCNDKECSLTEKHYYADCYEELLHYVDMSINKRFGMLKSLT